MLCDEMSSIVMVMKWLMFGSGDDNDNNVDSYAHGFIISMMMMVAMEIMMIIYDDGMCIIGGRGG